jgi:hypothetical protein
MSAACASACTGGATARLTLDNQTTSSSSRSGVLADGTSLRLKLLAVYLAADIDPVTMDNVGTTSMIWMNPECDGDISGCNVDGLVNPAGPRVTSYFDLSRPSAEITADLHSQDTTIDPGTYRYARIELCKVMGGETQPTVPTLRWAGPGMTEQPFTSTDCTRNSLAFDPPLALAEGDAVGVELGYDLATSIVTGTPASSSTFCGSHAIDGDPRCFRACADTSPTTRSCMDFPSFQPTATLR